MPTIPPPRARSPSRPPIPGDYDSYYDDLGTIPTITEPAVYDITGTDNADFEQGNAGGQSIDALGGDDTLFGDGQSPDAGDGDDLISRRRRRPGRGRRRDDQIIGGDDNDLIAGDY